MIGAFVLAAIALSAGTQQNQFSSLPDIGKAPELAGISGWINSAPLKIEDMKGKVVLVDFWTYSCINCIRTLPYLKGWHEKYAGKGLVVIGVHTPEFEFEKDAGNVKAAVSRYGIKYAVAMDNGYATWRAYKNNFWPRKYLIDKNGTIRYDHIGEGAYEETEKAILDLLGESHALSDIPVISRDVNFSKIRTPELYLGYGFARDALGNMEGFAPEETVNYSYVFPKVNNAIYLSGSWKNEKEKMVAVENARLFLLYEAKDVNIVAGGATEIKVIVDGEKKYFGRDIAEGKAVISGNRLYNVVSAPAYGQHLLEISASPGFELYTFTFG